MDAARHFQTLSRSRTIDFLSGHGRTYRNDLQSGRLEDCGEFQTSCSWLDWMGQPTTKRPNEPSRCATNAMGMQNQMTWTQIRAIDRLDGKVRLVTAYLGN